jgi:hypothetical protein
MPTPISESLHVCEVSGTTSIALGPGPRFLVLILVSSCNYKVVVQLIRVTATEIGNKIGRSPTEYQPLPPVVGDFK